MSSQTRPAPPDQPQRNRALDPGRSILVQAPAGSGKTDLLTRRFLRLLAEVEEPGQVVAITFTNAAAAEMRHRILSELENAAGFGDPKDERSVEESDDRGRSRQGMTLVVPQTPQNRNGALAPGGAISGASLSDPFSMAALARRALEHSQALGWKLLDLPAQLRISTIDSFCRDLALQQPLLSGLGGGLDIAEQPTELYRRAARQTLERLGQADPVLSQPSKISSSGATTAGRRWKTCSSPCSRSATAGCTASSSAASWIGTLCASAWNAPSPTLSAKPSPAWASSFTRFPRPLRSCSNWPASPALQTGGQLHRELAELAEFPTGPFSSGDALEEARTAWLGLASLLLTGSGTFRKAVDKRLGFPADRKREKAQLLGMIEQLKTVPGLESALAAVANLPPARYTEDDWQIVRACFTLLRHAAAELQVVFAEAGAVDFIEVAQIAQRVLCGEDGLPTDAAMAVSDGIRHMLVDEFQDTSRRQHRLLASLVAAWPERPGRTCFAVGDPMQSIYFFRDADAELFPRVQSIGLEIPDAEPLLFDFVPLKANFRTAPSLVTRLNEVFGQVFAANDGSGVAFSSAEPAREGASSPDPRLKLHLNFVPQAARGKAADPETSAKREEARTAQAEEIVALIRGHLDRMEQARARGEKYRIAVLGRARTALAPIAQALRQAEIPFRAVDLEKLATRPEVLDALALARALLNPCDRVAWLGLLRAPWCGLSLSDLHCLTSADDPLLLARAVPELLAERLLLLSEEGRGGAARVLQALDSATALRATQPTASLGTWLEQVWLALGGADCVDRTARANLDLLWSCLDRLPGGAEDLLGPALETALDKLTAQPDPGANTDAGVQLMTIHKSKGLEFEVVIVPDLQAGGGNGSRKMLSWLERGLAHPDDSGEITEFLIAPLPRKGDDRGTAKQWVDCVYRDRESQEMRRILYVAATRAREELHFFARPAFKAESDGTLSLPSPSASLLATAWPALEVEVRARFEEWNTARADSQASKNQVLDSIAAEGASNLLLMPSPPKPTMLRRLPPDWAGSQSPGLESGEDRHARELGAPSIPRLHVEWVGSDELQFTVFSTPQSATGLDLGTGENALYARHQGGPLSRALGTAVHALLEQLAHLRETSDWQSARAALQRFEPRIAAQIRATGVSQLQAAQIAAQALQHALNAASDPIGKWILSPHSQSAIEAAYAGVIRGSLRTVRVDRVFRAGARPDSEGEDCWWIVDYKTAHADDVDPAAALRDLRRLFAPQVEAYATILRKLHGADTPIRLGLYYPRMLLLDWWEL